jgi:ketosteroid isomerase-like protein
MIRGARMGGWLVMVTRSRGPIHRVLSHNAASGGDHSEGDSIMGTEASRAVVRGTYEAFASGDLEALFAAFADDAVWVNHTPSSTFHGEHKGVDELRAMVERMGEVMDLTHFELKTLVADGDHVVAMAEQAFTLKSTGETHSGPVIHFCQVHDDRITRVDEFEGDL